MAFTYFLILWSTAWSPSRLCESKGTNPRQRCRGRGAAASPPPPCWPHRAPWPGACSATQMCGAAAKLPGTGAGSTRPHAGAVLGMPQPRGPHGPDRPGEVTPERGGGKG